MRRRAFLGALAAGAAGAALDPFGLARACPWRTNPFLIPMDDAQPQPLRAYGIVYRALRNGGAADWLLNWRGGAWSRWGAPASWRHAVSDS